MEKIVELIGERDWKKGFPVLSQLRPHLTEKEFLELVSLASELENYRIKLLYHEGQPVSYIGYQPMITLYYGKFIWVSDLVTDAAHRSKGYGEKLLAHVEEEAEKEGFDGIALSSALHRKGAHRFYEEKMGFEKASYSFKKVFK
ncbi:GNAT family N-acetyltransferase [Bacillus sp. FJAT-42376]|uniref:GNAT family N-acetyltransferase n=1 Tax=Bacillus sp. FJAT-42376 TaxID=2014076 RepID=UPI000F4F206D|nr:GNAT family N-acetyltransferase [Bacillus sp. FJAT-42376]AZB42148.1 GNAT family N-acetyltransferase [Bacillus sp. FJAT-42376]